MTYPCTGTIRYEARPVSLNVSYGHHRRQRTEHVQEWRDTFAMLALTVPRADRNLEAVHVEVRCGMSGKLQDIGNCYVSAKAAIDGLVKAKIIADDTGDQILSLKFYPPERISPAELDYLELTWIEALPESLEETNG